MGYNRQAQGVEKDRFLQDHPFYTYGHACALKAMSPPYNFVYLLTEHTFSVQFFEFLSCKVTLDTLL